MRVWGLYVSRAHPLFITNLLFCCLSTNVQQIRCSAHPDSTRLFAGFLSPLSSSGPRQLGTRDALQLPPSHGSRVTALQPLNFPHPRKRPAHVRNRDGSS